MHSTLSCIMIVKDAAERLSRCLESVLDLADEIVVVDTGSTDNTIEIARRFTSHVHHFPWQDDFSAARNFSLLKATGDWCFWIDADEFLSEEAAQQIRSIVDQSPQRRSAFLMRQVSHAETVLKHDQVRLFGVFPEISWKRRVHEELVTSLNAANFTVYQCPHIEIKHVGYCELEELESKWRRNLRLIEMELEEDPNDHVSLLHKAHLSLKLDIEDGLGLLFEQALATFPPTDARIVLLCHDYSNWLLEKTKLAEAVAVSKHALASFPKHPITLTDLADLYWHAGNYAMAEASLRAIEFPPETGWAMGFSDEHLAMHARNNLAVLMRNQRRHQDAEQIWRNLLAYDAKFSPAIQGLGELFVILGRLDEAEALVAALAATAPSNQESSILLTRVLLRRSQYENARELINKLGRTDIRVRLLFAELCIATNDIHAAKREFLDILSHEPQHSEAQSGLAWIAQNHDDC